MPVNIGEVTAEDKVAALVKKHQGRQTDDWGNVWLERPLNLETISGWSDAEAHKALQSLCGHYPIMFEQVREMVGGEPRAFAFPVLWGFGRSIEALESAARSNRGLALENYRTSLAPAAFNDLPRSANSETTKLASAVLTR